MNYSTGVKPGNCFDSNPSKILVISNFLLQNMCLMNRLAVDAVGKINNSCVGNTKQAFQMLLIQWTTCAMVHVEPQGRLPKGFLQDCDQKEIVSWLVLVRLC